MKALLPLVEQELTFVSDYLREFARRYPKLAATLGVNGSVCEDPHVSRWIEAIAMLNARTSLRLTNNYPEFTEAMLQVNYPHYLQPFPACSIARVDYNDAHAAKVDAVTRIPRGTTMNSVEHQGVVCRFRTVFETLVAPITLSKVTFNPMVRAPGSVALPPAATSSISIVIEGTSRTLGLVQTNLASLRIFIDGAQPLCAALRDTLFMRTLAAYVEVGQSGHWHALDTIPLAPVGFAKDDALIPFKATCHPAYRLLTEYFAFPEKFNFFDIDLAALISFLPPGCNCLTLHLAVGDVRAASDIARILAPLSSQNLLLACTPVINLFRQQAAPISLTHTRAEYTLVAESARPGAYDIHSIDAVRILRETPHGDALTEFHPYYSLRHGVGGRAGHYWVVRRDEILAVTQPGHETQISFVDIDLDPTAVETPTVSVALTCTNRELPSRLPWGAPAGDLTSEAPAGSYPIRFLRKPSAPMRFAASAHWRLISHLSLNHRSLVQDDLDAFTEMLALYDLPQSAVSQRQISGIVGLAHAPARVWLDDENGGGLQHGIEVRLTVEEEAFVGCGLHAFAQVIDHFLGLYVHLNSFSQLVVLSALTGKELLRCQPRNGDLNLV